MNKSDAFMITPTTKPKGEREQMLDTSTFKLKILIAQAVFTQNVLA